MTHASEPHPFDRFMNEQPDWDAPAERVGLPTPIAAEPEFIEKCPKCRGTKRAFGGVCFKCQGRGQLTYKTSADDRALARNRRAQRLAIKIVGFERTYPTEMAWINARAPSFGFAKAMFDAIQAYGSLTDNQIAAVQKLMVQDAERTAARAVEREQREAAAVAVDITPIITAFRKAQLAGVKLPKVNLGGFRFRQSTKGPIYVTAGEAYLGKIEAGRFFRSRECTPAQEAEIVAVATDPKAAAIAYGQRTGSCCVCGRELTNKDSIDAMIGPICASRYGWG